MFNRWIVELIAEATTKAMKMITIQRPREFLIAVINCSITELMAAATTKATKKRVIQCTREFLIVVINRWIAK